MCNMGVRVNHTQRLSDMPNTNPHSAPIGAFSIPEFAYAFKIGRSTVYELIDSGKLKSFHVGRRRLISYDAAHEWQRTLESCA